MVISLEFELHVILSSFRLFFETLRNFVSLNGYVGIIVVKIVKVLDYGILVLLR